MYFFCLSYGICKRWIDGEKSVLKSCFTARQHWFFFMNRLLSTKPSIVVYMIAFFTIWFFSSRVYFKNILVWFYSYFIINWILLLWIKKTIAKQKLDVILFSYNEQHQWITRIFFQKKGIEIKVSRFVNNSTNFVKYFTSISLSFWLRFKMNKRRNIFWSVVFPIFFSQQ